MLKVKSLHYKYAKSFQLKDISFELNSGEILGVIGESGCGKTTLLKLIFGKLDKDSGELYWGNDEILGPSRQLIAGKEDFKYVTQEFELMPYISVLENIIKPLSRQHLDKNIKRAEELLDVLDLNTLKDKKVKNLSGGQKQRVALAQALAKKPKLLLLDEPFSHIDSYFKNELKRKLFKFIKDENITCIIATHDKADVLPFSDKILVLKTGKMLDFKSPETLYKNPKSSYVAGLFGDYNLINQQLIWPEKTSNEIIVYPNEIIIEVSKINEIEVLEQYFMGDHYKIIAKWKSQNLIIHTVYKLTESKNYSIGFNKDKLKERTI